MPYLLSQILVIKCQQFFQIKSILQKIKTTISGFFVLLRVLYEVLCLTKNCQAGVFHTKAKHSLRWCLSSLSYIAKILNSTCGFYKNRSHIHETLITKDSFSCSVAPSVPGRTG